MRDSIEKCAVVSTCAVVEGALQARQALTGVR